jgi:hypothetical protein
MVLDPAGQSCVLLDGDFADLPNQILIQRAVEARWANTKTLVREITEGTNELLEVAGKGEKAARTKKARQKTREVRTQA